MATMVVGTLVLEVWNCVAYERRCQHDDPHESRSKTIDHRDNVGSTTSAPAVGDPMLAVSSNTHLDDGTRVLVSGDSLVNARMKGMFDTGDSHRIER